MCPEPRNDGLRMPVGEHNPITNVIRLRITLMDLDLIA